MNAQYSPPSLAHFLTAPIQEVRAVAPQSMVYAAAGTRRAAALAGIEVDSEAYARWSHAQLLQACERIFAHGVQHIFTILATPGQFQEVGQYRARLMEWLTWGLGSPEAVADFRQTGWKVRALHDGIDPDLRAAEHVLRRLPAAPHAPTLWMLVVEDAETPWRWVFHAAAGRHAVTRADAIRALYGENVPLITLYLGFGKPVIMPELLPPLLEGSVNCYWTQRPGYSLTDAELRAIFYDYAYQRPTWQPDKSGRAACVLDMRNAWETGPILGLGRRLGPFWFPQNYISQPAGGAQSEAQEKLP